MDNNNLQKLTLCAREELNAIMRLRDVQKNLLNKYPDSIEIKTSVKSTLKYLQIAEMLARLQISSLS